MVKTTTVASPTPLTCRVCPRYAPVDEELDPYSADTSSLSSSGYAVAPASRVTNALKNFSTLNFRAGSNPVKLTKSHMKHILERHHPQYWNGTQTATQSFFNPKMSVSDVRSLIREALKKHSSSIKNLGTKRDEYFGTYNGVKYKLVVSNNQVVQFYPR